MHRRGRRAQERPPVRAVAGWGAFTIVAGAATLAIVSPGSMRDLVWLVPSGALVLGVATVAVWLSPMRPMPPPEQQPTGEDPARGTRST